MTLAASISWDDVIREFYKDLKKSFESKPKSKLYFTNGKDVESCAEVWSNFLVADALISILKQEKK